jgi:hypothetical protein
LKELSIVGNQLVFGAVNSLKMASSSNVNVVRVVLHVKSLQRK